MASSTIPRAIEQFIQDLIFLPVDHDLDNTLEHAVEAEREIRRLFACNPSNHQLGDRYLGLIDVFSLHPAARRTRARRFRSDTTESYDQHVFPVRAMHRRLDFTPSTVFSFEVFRQHWDIFTNRIFSNWQAKDWENIVVAGGSVLACLMTPYPKPDTLNEYYQSDVYGSCDIDLFLWGLSPQQAEIKMMDIYRAVCDATHWPVTCVRKAHTVSIHSTWPYRPIQIILRLYQSPAEILAGFDVDAPCCSYDGKRVLVNPRCLTALVRQSNTVDMTRRSPSYELRLAKYAKRGFEIYIPSLRRQQVKPAIYSKDLDNLPRGLARLLVLELFHYHSNFDSYLKKYMLDRNLAKQSLPPGDNAGLNIVMSHYDCNIKWANIPFGRTWDARRIEKMVASKDAWMNSIWLTDYFTLPDGLVKPPHRHVFFAGTMEQCIGSFCEQCDTQEDAEDLFANHEPDPYIKGPVRFLTTNPGQQLLTGSFRPINVEDWADEAYSDDVDSRHELNLEGLDSMQILYGILQGLQQ